MAFFFFFFLYQIFKSCGEFVLLVINNKDFDSQMKQESTQKLEDIHIFCCHCQCIFGRVNELRERKVTICGCCEKVLQDLLLLY